MKCEELVKKFIQKFFLLLSFFNPTPLSPPTILRPDSDLHEIHCLTHTETESSKSKHDWLQQSAQGNHRTQ